MADAGSAPTADTPTPGAAAEGAEPTSTTDEAAARVRRYLDRGLPGQDRVPASVQDADLRALLEEYDRRGAELERLRPIEQRAREAADPTCPCDGCAGCAAARILGEPS